jgi:aminopeptidase N
VVYNKGGYVLHMLRMMMQDPSVKTPDAPFAIMMQDFTKTFDGKAASTEDFKAIVERHMNADMDIDGNHRMDWFFNQYVYGVGIARYEFKYSLQPQGDKSCKLSVTLTRSQVPDNWRDVIPIYVTVGKNVNLIGRIEAKTPTTSFETVLPFTPQKVSINDNLDTLAEVKQ